LISAQVSHHLIADAGLYTWGSNAHNQLGHYHQKELFAMMRELKEASAPSDVRWDEEAEEVVVGRERDHDGDSGSSESSTGPRSYTVAPREPIRRRLAASTTWLCAEPRLVGGPLQSKTIVHVACGANHMACVTDEGDVYTWGYGGKAICDRDRVRVRRWYLLTLTLLQGEGRLVVPTSSALENPRSFNTFETPWTLAP
jgi:alpha-tubulin suppressor-like RCC1 family protein